MSDWIETEIERRVSRMVFPTLGGLTKADYEEMLREQYRLEDREEELHEMRFREFIRRQSGGSSSSRPVVSDA